MQTRSQFVDFNRYLDRLTVEDKRNETIYIETM